MFRRRLACLLHWERQYIALAAATAARNNRVSTVLVVWQVLGPS